MNHTVYLKLSQITELTHKDVVLKDVAQVYCDDQNVMNKCNSMKVMTVKVDAKRRYIMSALDVINKLKQLDSTIDVNNVGETDFIIDINRLPRLLTSGSGPRLYLSAWCVFSALHLPL